MGHYWISEMCSSETVNVKYIFISNFGKKRSICTSEMSKYSAECADEKVATYWWCLLVIIREVDTPQLHVDTPHSTPYTKNTCIYTFFFIKLYCTSSVVLSMSNTVILRHLKVYCKIMMRQSFISCQKNYHI